MKRSPFEPPAPHVPVGPDKCIFAHTANSSPYPPYLSINRRNGVLTIAVRGGPFVEERGGPYSEGSYAQIALPLEAERDFFRTVADHAVWDGIPSKEEIVEALAMLSGEVSDYLTGFAGTTHLEMANRHAGKLLVRARVESASVNQPIGSSK